MRPHEDECGRMIVGQWVRKAEKDMVRKHPGKASYYGMGTLQRMS